MAITRSQFLMKQVAPDLIEHELPDGDTVLLRPATAKLYREYRRSLRDKEGEPIVERQEYGDELLVGRLLMQPDGSELMFTDDEILGGVLDNMPLPALGSVITKAYQMLGIVNSDEDREKNSSGTASTEQS